MPRVIHSKGNLLFYCWTRDLLVFLVVLWTKGFQGSRSRVKIDAVKKNHASQCAPFLLDKDPKNYQFLKILPDLNIFYTNQDCISFYKFHVT